MSLFKREKYPVTKMPPITGDRMIDRYNEIDWIVTQKKNLIKEITQSIFELECEKANLIGDALKK